LRLHPNLSSFSEIMAVAAGPSFLRVSTDLIWLPFDRHFQLVKGDDRCCTCFGTPTYGLAAIRGIRGAEAFLPPGQLRFARVTPNTCSLLHARPPVDHAWLSGYFT